MQSTTNINSEDWSVLKEALLWSGLLVIMASPQGALGLTQESTALGQALRAMLAHGAGYNLIDKLRRELAETPGEQLRLPIDSEKHGESSLALRNLVLQRIRQANRILLDKASAEEAAYYKRGLLWVGLQVANAAREGGSWLNRSAEAVTQEEREALRQLAFLFGLPANEAVVEQLPEVPSRQIPGELADIYSLEEWALLRQAPVWVAAAVSTATPNGIIGMARELAMTARALHETRQSYPDNRLIRVLIDEMIVQPGVVMPTKEQPLTPETTLQRAMQICRQVRELMLSKAQADEADQFKHMLLLIGKRVAEGGREGGFLGIGGELVSQEERQALAQIAAALGVEGDAIIRSDTELQ